MFPLLVFLVFGVFGGGVSFPLGLLDILNKQVVFSLSINLFEGLIVPILKVIPKLGLTADSTIAANKTLP